MKLSEALDKRTGLQHEEAVYDELIIFLEQFLPTDMGPAESLLEVEGCLTPMVSHEALDKVQQKLVSLRKEVARELETLNKLEVTPAKTKPKRKTTRDKKTT
jgi:hypothetical protein|tara:strand:+ start:339 stop:644 length:306 start_codon:yes stop_codon:yes gene_type:complete